VNLASELFVENKKVKNNARKILLKFIEFRCKFILQSFVLISQDFKAQSNKNLTKLSES